MDDLANQVCEACQVGAPKVTAEEAKEYLTAIPEWRIDDQHEAEQLVRRYEFNNFVDAMAFADRVGELAEQHGHHPGLFVEWGQATVFWWTHKINGLHKNDFILAAKTDALLES